jgi:hypothetical protein
MTTTRRIARGTLVGLLALGLGMAGAELAAQVTMGKSRPLRTHTLMEYVNKVHCGALKTALDGDLSNEEARDEAAEHAELLNEAGHILMADGRCPDADWAKAAKALQDKASRHAPSVCSGEMKPSSKRRSAGGLAVVEIQ